MVAVGVGSGDRHRRFCCGLRLEERTRWWERCLGRSLGSGRRELVAIVREERRLVGLTGDVAAFTNDLGIADLQEACCSWSC